MSEVCEGYNGSVRNLIIPERPCWGSCCFGELHTRNLLQSVGFGLQSEGMIRNASRACGAPFPNLLRAQPLVFIAGHPLTSRLVVQWRFCLSPVDPAPSFLLLLLKHKVDLGSDSRKGLEYSIYYGRETKWRLFQLLFQEWGLANSWHWCIFIPRSFSAAACLSVCRGAASPCLVWCSHHWQQETSDTWAQVCVEPWSTQYLSWHHCPLQSPHSVCWCCFAVKLSSLVFP